MAGVACRYPNARTRYQAAEEMPDWQALEDVIAVLLP